MYRKSIAAVAAVTILVVTAALCFQPTTVDSPAADDPTAVTATPYRIIGEWQGRVAVFSAGEETPEQVYDTAVSSLPKSEQERLKKGVEATDASTLKLLLENYLS